MSSKTRDVRNRVNTRARLLDAAADVFVEKGFSGVKIDDVVKAAGFTRGAFYSNYSSMDEVLKDVLVQRAHTIVDEIEAALAGIEGEPDVGTIMAVLDSFSAQGRTMYVLTCEYNLYMMRHPELIASDDAFPVTEREQLEAAVGRIVRGVLARMGRQSIFEPGVISRILTTFYLESFAPSMGGGTNKRMLAQMIKGLIFASSRLISSQGDNWDATNAGLTPTWAVPRTEDGTENGA